MGNTFAKNNANDTINWNSIKTDNISDNINGGALTNDSKLLLDRLSLNIPKNFAETESLSEVDNIFSKYQHVAKVKSENELSDTSPFISSEMYNLLMKPELDRNTTVAKQVGGKIEGDDSSTSETSSSSNSDSDSDMETATVSQKKNKKGKKQHKSKAVSSQQDSANELSYVSSSAHTNSGSENNNYKNKKNAKVSKKESLVSSEASSEASNASSQVSSPASNASSQVSSPASSAASSVVSESGASSNEHTVSTIPNLNSKLPRSSIATSDINMITED
jgi:epidermal growth factor receptor substrate 15